MKKETNDSRLIPILREGIAVIQMILFKSLKPVIARKHPDLDSSTQAMLNGAISNEIFGSHNTEEKFQVFRNTYQGIIEQELLGLHQELPQLRDALADTLRTQVLCDNQEGIDSTNILTQADNFKLLPADREIPLPSAFMETVRTLGALHKLVIPPIEIDASEEKNLLQ